MTDTVFRSEMSVELYKHNASDLDVARAAWVSTKGDEAREADSDRIAGLLAYLMRERHGSPWEHGSFTFQISCPIFVVREFHRHRAGWSYNEESGRYSEMKPVFYLPGVDRKLVQTGKTGHYIFGTGTDEQYNTVYDAIHAATYAAWDSYKVMLNDGVAREVARMVLPLNTYTTFWATCNPRSLMHFLSLRTEVEESTYPSHPQREIAMVAELMEAEFANTMPLTYKAWNDSGRVAP